MTKSNNIQNLYHQYSAINYPMGTGSDDWWDIKTDFELLDDSIVGLTSILDAKGRGDGKNEFISSRVYIEDLSASIDARLKTYIPTDEVEISEKELLAKKLRLILEIYQHYKSRYE